MPEKLKFASHRDGKVFFYFASIRALLEEAPALLEATDAKGLNGLHAACAVSPGRSGAHEPNGLETVAALLDAGIDIERMERMERSGV
jgi:hypothetical protein